MARKPKQADLPQVNKALEGFEIKINEFGEIVSNLEINKMNEFLDSNVPDKKFRGIDVIKKLDEDDISSKLNHSWK